MGEHPTVAVIAHGCPKNLVDTEHLLASMGVAGYDLTSDPEAADIVIITTCAFLGSAVAESEKTVRRLLKTKRRRQGMKVVVAGCLVQRFGSGIRKRLPGVDLFVGLDAFTDIPGLLNKARNFVSSSPSSRLLTSRNPRLLSTPGHYAYLKIADGCDNWCSYCLLPSIRGRLRSRRVPDLVQEAENLAQLGVKEIILVAQDTTAYGTDIYRGPALPRLLRKLSAIDRIHWLRLMYAHPAHITEELIEQFATNTKLCSYIDLPIQHISDRILEKMNRRYLQADIEQLLGRFRSIPDMRIRTTLIIGFPGETRKEFEDLLAFVRMARFDRLGAYAYSPEPGTRAHGLRNQVPEPLKQERLKRLFRVQATISRRNLGSLLGRRIRVLMDTTTTGRTEWDAPEIDGKVKLAAPAKPGTFITAQVTGIRTHDILARRIRTSS